MKTSFEACSGCGVTIDGKIVYLMTWETNDLPKLKKLAVCALLAISFSGDPNWSSFAGKAIIKQAAYDAGVSLPGDDCCDRTWDHVIEPVTNHPSEVTPAEEQAMRDAMAEMDRPR